MRDTIIILSLIRCQQKSHHCYSKRCLYLSNINVMKVGLEILVLVFRTCRILIETGLRLSLFLNMVTIVSQFEKPSPCCMDSRLNNLFFNLPCCVFHLIDSFSIKVVCVSCNYGISKYFLSLQEFHS